MIHDDSFVQCHEISFLSYEDPFADFLESVDRLCFSNFISIESICNFLFEFPLSRYYIFSWTNICKKIKQWIFYFTWSSNLCFNLVGRMNKLIPLSIFFNNETSFLYFSLQYQLVSIIYFSFYKVDGFAVWIFQFEKWVWI